MDGTSFLTLKTTERRFAFGHSGLNNPGTLVNASGETGSNGPSQGSHPEQNGEISSDRFSSVKSSREKQYVFFFFAASTWFSCVLLLLGRGGNSGEASSTRRAMSFAAPASTWPTRRTF